MKAEPEWLRQLERTLCSTLDQDGSAAMHSVKRSVGVTPEVNLRNPLHEGSALALKLKADISRNPKQRHQWPQGKDLCPPKKI